MYKPPKSKTKSREAWGEWSDWVWSEEQQRYYKWRQSLDDGSKYDYEWAPLQGSSSASADPVDKRTPRRGDLDELTERVGSLATSDSDYPESAQADDIASYGSSPKYAYSASGHKSTKPSKTSKNVSSGTGTGRKGKSRAHSDDEDKEEEDEQSYGDPSGYPHEQREHYKSKAHTSSSQAHQAYEASSYQLPQNSYQSYGAYGGQGYSVTTHEVPGYGSQARYPSSTAESNPSVTAPTQNESKYATPSYGSAYDSYANSTSRFDAHGYGGDEEQETAETDEYSAAESRDYQRAIDDSRDPEYQSHSANYGESSSAAASAYAPQPYAQDPEYMQSTPTQGFSSLDIKGTGGETEMLDPRYRVEPSGSFMPGEVFKVLWSEPSGNANVGGTPTISDRKEIRNQFGSFYVGFRRFIVIANDEGHCTCVPILTYGGKGCKKRGVKPQKHGIVHERGHKARPLPDEPKLGFPPVTMKILAEGEKLAKESRANYSKLVTVEHNVKVFFIGHVVPEDWDMVRDAVNKCWEDKIHHKRKTHGKYARS